MRVSSVTARSPLWRCTTMSTCTRGELGTTARAATEVAAPAEVGLHLPQDRHHRQRVGLGAQVDPLRLAPERALPGDAVPAQRGTEHVGAAGRDVGARRCAFARGLHVDRDVADQRPRPAAASLLRRPAAAACRASAARRRCRGRPGPAASAACRAGRGRGPRRGASVAVGVAPAVSRRPRSPPRPTPVRRPGSRAQRQGVRGGRTVSSRALVDQHPAAPRLRQVEVSSAGASVAAEPPAQRTVRDADAAGRAAAVSCSALARALARDARPASADMRIGIAPRRARRGLRCRSGAAAARAVPAAARWRSGPSDRRGQRRRPSSRAASVAVPAGRRAAARACSADGSAGAGCAAPVSGTPASMLSASVEFALPRSAASGTSGLGSVRCAPARAAGGTSTSTVVSAGRYGPARHATSARAGDQGAGSKSFSAAGRSDAPRFTAALRPRVAGGAGCGGSRLELAQFEGVDLPAGELWRRTVCRSRSSELAAPAAPVAPAAPLRPCAPSHPSRSGGCQPRPAAAGLGLGARRTEQSPEPPMPASRGTGASCASAGASTLASSCQRAAPSLTSGDERPSSCDRFAAGGQAQRRLRFGRRRGRVQGRRPSRSAHRPARCRRGSAGRCRAAPRGVRAGSPRRSAGTVKADGVADVTVAPGPAGAAEAAGAAVPAEAAAAVERQVRKPLRPTPRQRQPGSKAAPRSSRPAAAPGPIRRRR